MRGAVDLMIVLGVVDMIFGRPVHLFMIPLRKVQALAFLLAEVVEVGR